MNSDLIFVSMENWDEIWRRNQFLCAGLARRFPERRILFVGVPRNVGRHLRKGSLTQLLKGLTRPIPGFPNITFTQPLRVGPERYRWGRKLNEALARRHIRSVSRQLGLTAPTLWLNPHYALHLVGNLEESAVIYDITDDWTSFAQPHWLTQQIVDQDACLCRRADAVIVCSQRLMEMKKQFTERLYLIPNGVDIDHYAQVCSSDRPLPPDALRWERPIFGYTGTVHPERVDIELIEKIARGMSKGTVALIGPCALSPAQRARLEETGKVVICGPVPYQKLPDYMRAFDVSITPHRVTEFTESLNPIKLWEYLAAGKPIVSTPVAGFRDFPELVYLAQNAAGFLAASAQALSEKPSISEQRRRIAREHSWASRLNDVERVLHSVVPGHSAGVACGIARD